MKSGREPKPFGESGPNGLAALPLSQGVGATASVQAEPGDRLTTTLRPGAAVTSEEQFAVCYQRDFSPVASYCYQLTRDRELAHDMAQEAFARLFARWVSVREPRAYVFHIATNLVRAAWRSRERDRGLFRHLSRAESVAAHDGDVYDAVRRLPARYREVVLLHYYADLTVPDVSAAVRRPEGTVKRLLSEARTLLAGALQDPR